MKNKLYHEKEEYFSQEEVEKEAQEVQNTQKALSHAWLYGAMVSSMTSSIVAGILIGVALDWLLSTSPICTFIFLFLGCIGGFIFLFRIAKRLENDPSLR